MSFHDRRRMTATTWALVAGLAVSAGAQGADGPASPHHGFLGGPWEILAKMGHEGAAIRLPLSVRDENQPQEMDAALPVMGTPLTIRAKRYLPNLAWETKAVEDPDGGPAVRLSLRGGNLHQDLWLGGRDRERQSISAHVGGVALRELPARDAAVAAVEKLTDPNTVGILLVWLRETDPPLVYAAQPGESVTLPESDWRLTFVRYVPHYSIDRATKEVTNLSEKPVNPALEVRLDGAGREYRQWLWSQFAMSPHRLDVPRSSRLEGLPFRARFLDFDLTGTAGQYLLAVTQDRQVFAFYLKDGRRHVERVKIGQRYPFSDERYTFAVEELCGAATVADAWKNSSDVLLHPAVVAEIAQGAQTREVVLELNKPCHHQTAQGMLVVLYRRVP